MTPVTGEGDGLDEPVTFAAFAERIGRSRPYVSKLKAEGRITARSFAPDGKIIPRLALEDMAASADPARTKRPLAEASDTTFARQRARLTQANADRAELELRARKGELIERGIIAATLGPWIRELRDTIAAAPRDTVLDPVQAADCETRLTEALAEFSTRLTSLAETPADGGAGAVA